MQLVLHFDTVSSHRTMHHCSMPFRCCLVLVFAVTIFTANGSLSSAAFKIENTQDDGRGIYAKTKLEERRNFIHLFNVPYIVCFYAAKGKWPFVPSFMQVQVDQVGRSIFPQTDGFIRNFCRKWIQIKECFRPSHIIPVHPDPDPKTPAPIPAINTEVETFEIMTTPCSCARQIYQEPTPAGPVVFFDKNYIGNVSADTILNTIEFLESFLPPPTKKPKRKNKIRDRL